MKTKENVVMLCLTMAVIALNVVGVPPIPLKPTALPRPISIAGCDDNPRKATPCFVAGACLNAHPVDKKNKDKGAAPNISCCYKADDNGLNHCAGCVPVGYCCEILVKGPHGNEVLAVKVCDSSSQPE
jgi:hypothetical protein